MESGPLGERLLARKVDLVAFEKCVEEFFQRMVDLQSEFGERVNSFVKDKGKLSDFEKASLLGLFEKVSEKLGIPFDSETAMRFMGVRDIRMYTPPVNVMPAPVFEAPSLTESMESIGLVNGVDFCLDEPPHYCGEISAPRIE